MTIEELSNLRLGNKVSFLPPLKPGIGCIVARIPKGEVPAKFDITLWYGTDAPKSAYRALAVDRVIVSREGTAHYVVLPVSNTCAACVKSL